MPMWLFWFLLGVALVASEALLAFTLYAGAIALGAFPAAIVAALGGSVELQVAVFAAGAIFSLAVLRPIAKRQLITPPATRTGTDTRLGAHATVIEAVDDDRGVVKIRGGDTWSARSLDRGRRFEPGEEVVVRSIRGVAVIVDAIPEAEDPDEPAAGADIG
ncbi:MAG TPA: NfeD family protein [Solirubrobacterales bacterium]|nr:NfeD family protein [Solirubrobacterales bacterium]